MSEGKADLRITDSSILLVMGFAVCMDTFPSENALDHVQRIWHVWHQEIVHNVPGFLKVFSGDSCTVLCSRKQQNTPAAVAAAAWLEQPQATDMWMTSKVSAGDRHALYLADQRHNCHSCHSYYSHFTLWQVHRRVKGVRTWKEVCWLGGFATVYNI